MCPWSIGPWKRNWPNSRPSDRASGPGCGASRARRWTSRTGTIPTTSWPTWKGPATPWPGWTRKNGGATRRRRSPPAPCNRRLPAVWASLPGAPWPWPSNSTRAWTSARKARSASSPTCALTRPTWPRRLRSRHGPTSVSDSAPTSCHPSHPSTKPRPRALRRPTRPFAPPRSFEIRRN